MHNSVFIQISGILLLSIAQILPTSCFAPTSAASRVTPNTHPQLHHDSLFHCTIITGQRYQCLSGKRENYDDQSDPNSPMGIRLNKVFKATHSRRQADELIASGRVSINGEQVLSKGGCKVMPFRDVVALDGKVVRGWEKMNAIGRNDDGSNERGSVKRGKKQNGNGDELKTSSFEYVKYFKPLGVTCTTDLNIRDNIIDSIWRDGYRPRHRVYPVGRLDKETSGLIILTSDGRVVNSVLRGEKKQPKVYKVMVDGRLDEYHLQRLRVSFCACFIFEVFFNTVNIYNMPNFYSLHYHKDGITIKTVAQRKGRTEEQNTLIAKTKRCKVERIGPSSCQMTLVEGRNRQIRKMMQALGFTVVRLHRIEFMGIQLSNGLQGPGDWAYLDAGEMELVKNALRSAQEEIGN